MALGKNIIQEIVQEGAQPAAPNPLSPEFKQSAEAWLTQTVDQFTSPAMMWQLVVIAAAAVIAFVLSRYPIKQLKASSEKHEKNGLVFRTYQSIARILWPAFTVLFLWAATAAFEAYEIQNHALRIIASLLNAWIVVRVITSNLRGSFWSSALAFITWLIAALYILRLLSPITQSLDAVALDIGGVRFSLLRVITSVAVAALALWVGRVAGNVAQSRLRSTKSLTPSMAGLLGQVAKIGAMVIALMIALNTVGVNLTALTVFSGAIGIGIGFGLQTIFSNFISGIIILIEKSITVGDFIELQSGVTGEVMEISIRSTLITTNDNVDILVPNEEFIKAQVINWTLKESLRRMRISFGVAYGTDKEVVLKAGLEAAAAVEWTFDDGGARAPQVWLVGFGDSSLDYQLVVWITEDAVKRPARVEADYNWALHSALQKYDLEIPFPQRDLHLRSPQAIQVKLQNSD